MARPTSVSGLLARTDRQKGLRRLLRARLADLMGQLDALDPRLPHLSPPDEIEVVHDARVAGRRLRAVLQLASFRPKTLRQEARAGVVQLSRALGEVRDRDLLLAWLGGVRSAEPPAELASGVPPAETPAELAPGVRSAEPPVESAPGVRSAEPPAELAPGVRSAEPPVESAPGVALRDLIDQVKAARHERRDMLWPEIERFRAGGAAALSACAAGLHEQGRLGGRAVRRRYRRRMQEVGRLLPPALSGEARAVHQLRIAVKKLRYHAETLAGVVPRTGRLLALLQPLQEQLGALHDVDARLSWLHQQPGGFPWLWQRAQEERAAAWGELAPVLSRLVADDALRPFIRRTRRG